VSPSSPPLPRTIPCRRVPAAGMPLIVHQARPPHLLGNNRDYDEVMARWTAMPVGSSFPDPPPRAKVLLLLRLHLGRGGDSLEGNCL
jgi:hypothetical protein